MGLKPRHDGSRAAPDLEAQARRDLAGSVLDALTRLSDRYSGYNHAQANQYSFEAQVRSEGHEVLGSEIISLGRYYHVKVTYRGGCR